MAAVTETVLQPSAVAEASEPSGRFAEVRSNHESGWRARIVRAVTTVSAHRFELLCSMVFAALALARVGPMPFPLGIGGLYALMAQSIQNAHFLLPEHIPYYGPGGIPFAYPPAALYVLAALAEIPHTSILTWFRYLPVIMCALSVWPVYGLYRELLPGRLMARVAVVLFAVSPAWLASDLWADGSVRSFAFFWAMLALLFAWRALNTGARRNIIAASACFAFALASHPEVTVFLGLSLLVFVVARRPYGTRFFRATVIMAAGTVIAGPWWLTVVSRSGLGPFLSSTHTHGGIAGQIQPHASGALQTIAVIVSQYAAVDPRSLPIYVIALLGFARCIRQKAWTLPLWTITLCILMPEGQRFVALGAAGAASIPLVEIPLQVCAGIIRSTNRGRWVALGVLCLTGLYSAWHMYQWEFSVAPNLTRPTLQAAEWLRAHTPRDARFLAVSDVQDQPEWLPYFAHRTPVMGHWGAEWTPGYPRQAFLIASEQRCAQLQSYACLQSLIREQHLAPDYLVLMNRGRLGRLQRQIASQPHWHRVYVNTGVAVWETAGA